jgi:pimeloyl-ACP methyl ester carboxylesterase
MMATARIGGRWVRRLLGLVLALLLVPPGVFFLARGVLAAANVVLERRYPPPGRMVSVGDHRLHLFCQGSGTPTVVVEPGLGVDWVAWAPIVMDLAQSVEVCVYDRAGYGWSEPGPIPRTAQQSAEELHQLLTNSTRREPYVIVAHSFGGHIARVYAGKYGSTLGGVVLVDPAEQNPEDMPIQPPPTSRPASWSRGWIIDSLPPLGWERIKRLKRGEDGLSPDARALPPAFRHRVIIASSLNQLAAEQSELKSARPSQIQARAAAFPRDVPLVVISPLYLSTPQDRSTTPTSLARRELLRKLAESSTQGTQIFARESGHMVHVDQPALVVSVIRDVISRVPQKRQ